MKRLLLVVAGGVLALTAAWAAAPERGEGPAPGNAAARAAAARKVYEGTLARYRRDSTFRMDPETLHLWSRRWMDADHELAQTRAARLAAVEGHLARMRDWEKQVTAAKEQGFVTPVDLAAAEFFRLEAETALAREKAR
jgi:hypothetical protein